MSSYDAILIASYGGPESQEEVIPFLQRATAGRGIPLERLEEVGGHYRALGGVSPINSQNRALITALVSALQQRGVDVPVKLGNRNSQPFLADTVRELHAGGARSVLAVATSVYASYSSCRQYREDLARALSDTGLAGELEIVKVRPAFDRAAFIQTSAELLAETLRALPVTPASSRIMFTTHSIPLTMALAAGPRAVSDPAENLYTAQHLQVARACMAALAEAAPQAAEVPWELVYQSRSGPPQVPWLEPDVNDAIRRAAAAGVRQVVLVPIGFISDHVEVVWDLDTEAAATAAAAGINLTRVPTVGTHPRFVAGLADLLTAHIADPGDHPAAGWEAFCGETCCPAPARRQHGTGRDPRGADGHSRPAASAPTATVAGVSA